jgi:two-component system chemotaxis sensor kinase CheA
MESSLYDDGLINEFISEAGEHLAGMESDLMILEGVENAYDENLVNNIFRSAHTIKGSAGMLGFDQIAKLAHKMENLLHFVREGSLTLDHSGFQVLFQALDVLTMMVNTPQNSEDVDISQPLELLGTILPEKSRVQADQQVTIETPGRPSMFTVDQLTLELAEKSGKFVYLVEFDLIHDIHGKGKTPAHLLQDLENSGTVLNCRVEVNAVGDLDSGFSNSIPLYVLFSSVAEPALAPALFEIEEARVHHIDKPVVSAEEMEASSEAPGQNPDSEWSESVGEVSNFRLGFCINKL